VLGDVLTASVTPFDADGAVNLPKFRELATFLVENGSDGLVVTGTTGESPTLTDDERFTLFEAAVDELSGSATIIAGTGTYDTAHSVHLTERAHAIGVDGFLVVTPYYNLPPPRAIVAHFRAVAEASDRPIIVYNIPQRVVRNIDPDTMSELAEIPTVRAVKQATPDLDQARRILAETDLDLYAGNDDLILPFLELGGVGGVCVYTNVVGSRVKEMIRRFREEDADGARAIEAELKPVIEALAVTTNPIPVKAALSLLGWDVGGLRLPLLEATEAEREAIRGALERAGLLTPTPA
jgi:4-hydroxy-tetrahydrodipicolinate synthase